MATGSMAEEMRRLPDDVMSFQEFISEVGNIWSSQEEASHAYV
jgi:hypothetical protein